MSPRGISAPLRQRTLRCALWQACLVPKGAFEPPTCRSEAGRYIQVKLRALNKENVKGFKKPPRPQNKFMLAKIKIRYEKKTGTWTCFCNLRGIHDGRCCQCYHRLFKYHLYTFLRYVDYSSYHHRLAVNNSWLRQRCRLTNFT